MAADPNPMKLAFYATVAITIIILYLGYLA